MSNTLYKGQGDRLADYLSRVHGVKLKRAFILEAVAHMHGRPDWNTLLAAGARVAAEAPTPEQAITPTQLMAKPGAVEGPLHIEQSPSALYHQAVVLAIGDPHVSTIQVSLRGNSASVSWRRAGRLERKFDLSPRQFADLKEFIGKCAGLAPHASTSEAAVNSPMNGTTKVHVHMRSSNRESHLLLNIRRPVQLRELSQLGISRVDVWRRGLERKSGMCLIGGMTGSGKTTTLAASMQDVLPRDRVVLQEPNGFSEPWHANISTTDNFSAAMRRDCEVVGMSGLIRSKEPAAQALKAAESGHLLVAPIHVGSITAMGQRLRDCGLSAENISTNLHTAIVQRKVPSLCQVCKGRKCDDCHHTGHGGSTVISECVHFISPDEVRRMLDGEVWWPTMLDDAILKVEQGIISIDEVERIFGRAGVLRIRQLATRAPA